MELDNKKLSFLMAERLKKLRENQGLSHDKLSGELYKKYKDADNTKKPEYRKKRKKEGNDETLISRDSLIKYEVSQEYAKTPYANAGMNVEFVRYLADFYNVSSDFLIGLSDIASTDTSVKAICESSSIPEWMVENFITFANSPCIRNFFEVFFSIPLDVIEKFANKYIGYSMHRNATLPVIERNQEKLKNKNISIKTEINGEQMIEVPWDKLNEYIKFIEFEFCTLFIEILQQGEQYRENNICQIIK